MNASVLVLDDDRAFVELVSLILRDAGLKVTAFWDVRQAMRALRAGEIAVDVALLDQRMAFCSGPRFLRHLQFADPGVLGISITGYGKPESDLESFFFDFMQKPFRNEDLLFRVFRALYARARTREGAAVSVLPIENVSDLPREARIDSARRALAECDLVVVSGADAEDSSSRDRLASRLRPGARVVFCHSGFLPERMKRAFQGLLAEIRPARAAVQAPWRSWRDLRADWVEL